MQVIPHVPGEVFEAEQEYAGPMNTLGDLTRAHIANTAALRRANNKLATLCVAAKRCKGKD